MPQAHGITATANAQPFEDTSLKGVVSDGLNLWLDSDRGTTPNGANTSAWADQSPSGVSLVQATAANQPALTSMQVNGHAAVIPHDATDELVDTTLVHGTLTGFTTFTVFKATDTVSLAAIQQRGDGTNVVRHLLMVANLLAFNGIDAFGFSKTHGYFGFTDTTKFHIVEEVFDGSLVGDANRAKAYLDGAQQVLITPDPVPASYDLSSSPGCSIGRYRGNSVGYTQLQAAVLFFDRALTATERGQVGRWLTQRYDLQTTY